MPDRSDAPGPVADPVDPAATAAPPVVDFPRTLRRLRRALTIIGAAILVAWGVAGAVGDGWSLRLLAELLGFGLFAAFVVEVVVVGGSATAGMLRAGERGDRLSSDDVSLLPPQLTKRLRR